MPTIANILIAVCLCAGVPASASFAGVGPGEDAPSTQVAAPAPSAAPAPAPATTTVSPNEKREKIIAATDAAPAFPSSFKPKPSERKQAGGPTTHEASEKTGWGAVASMAGPLAVVLVVIFAGAMIFKKAARASGSLAASRAPSGIVEVLGRYSVGRGQQLLLMKVDQRVVLIGQCPPVRGSGGSLSTLLELADPQDVAAVLLKVSESEPTGHANTFNRLLGEADQHGESAKQGVLAKLGSMLHPNKPVSWDESQFNAGANGGQKAPSEEGVGTMRSRLATIRGAAS